MYDDSGSKVGLVFLGGPKFEAFSQRIPPTNSRRILAAKPKKNPPSWKKRKHKTLEAWQLDGGKV